jgi:hypothetical protein
MSDQFIYSLYHEYNGTQIYFYVGRSSRELGIRYAEHQYAAKSKAKQFDTDVYNYIRANVTHSGEKYEFTEKVLCWCDPKDDGNPNDYEDYWVIKMIMDGHPLQNEKHGDERRTALLKEAHDIKDSEITLNSVKKLREYRERATWVRSEELRAKIKQESIENAPEKSKKVYEWLAEQADITRKKNIELRVIEAVKAKRRKDADLKLQQYLEQRKLQGVLHPDMSKGNKNI